MKKPWKIKSKKLIFTSKHKYRLWNDTLEYKNGYRTDYMYLERNLGYVVIVPVNKKGEIVFLKNWRYNGFYGTRI